MDYVGYMEKLSEDMVKMAMLDAYIDEMEKIAAQAHEDGDLEKEAGIQYGLAALKALRTGGRAAKAAPGFWSGIGEGLRGLRSGWSRGLAQAGRIEQTGRSLREAQTLANTMRAGTAGTGAAATAKTPVTTTALARRSTEIGPRFTGHAPGGTPPTPGAPGVPGAPPAGPGGMKGFIQQQKDLLTGLRGYRTGARSSAARNIMRASGARGSRGAETALRTGGVEYAGPGTIPTLRGGTAPATLESMPQLKGPTALSGANKPGIGKLPFGRIALGAGAGIGVPMAIASSSRQGMQPRAPSYAQRYAAAGGFQ